MELINILNHLRKGMMTGLSIGSPSIDDDRERPSIAVERQTQLDQDTADLTRLNATLDKPLDHALSHLNLSPEDADIIKRSFIEEAFREGGTHARVTNVTYIEETGILYGDVNGISDVILEPRQILDHYAVAHTERNSIQANQVCIDPNEFTPATIINKEELESSIESSLDQEYSVTIGDPVLTSVIIDGEEIPICTPEEMAQSSLEESQSSSHTTENNTSLAAADSPPIISDTTPNPSPSNIDIATETPSTPIQELTPEQTQQMSDFSDERYTHHMGRIQSEMNGLNGLRNSPAFQELSPEKQMALNERMNLLSQQRNEIYDIVDRPIEEQAHFFENKDTLEPQELLQQEIFQRTMQSQGVIADALRVDTNDESFRADVKRTVAGTIATGKAVGTVAYETVEGVLTLGVGTVKFAGSGLVGVADLISGGWLSENSETVRDINAYGRETSENIVSIGETLYDSAVDVTSDAIEGAFDSESEGAARTAQRFNAAGESFSNYLDATQEAYQTGDFNALSDHLKTPVDIATMAIPGVGATKLRHLNRLDDLADLGRAASRLEDGADIGRQVNRLDNVADTGRRLDNAHDLSHVQVLRNGEHFDELGRLKPNIRYQAGEYDYLYRTDSSGRLTHVEADNLQLTTRDQRLPHDPNTPGKIRGEDHAGHIIGDRFGGSPELDNLVSQLSRVNLSEYKKIENLWADAIADGKKVSIDVKIHYDGNNLRPDRFDIEFVIDNEFIERSISNIRNK